MRKIELKYIVKKEDNNIKVSSILQNKLKISNRLLIKLKMNEKILVNNKPVFSNYIVQENDEIIVNIDFIEEDYIHPEEMKLDILYEDEYILAVNKPTGIVVHPSANHQSGTLANGVKYYLNNNKKIRPINRLDRDTSGIVLFAKNEYIQELMNIHRKIQKEYIALIDGILEKKSGTINMPIRRKNGSIMEREVSEEGQNAVTNYEVLKEFNIIFSDAQCTLKEVQYCRVEHCSPNNVQNISILRINIETGRTHQIRVHMAYLGHPIIGDTLYGKESSLINRQALHAYHIAFEHPITKELIKIIAPLPDDMNFYTMGTEEFV